MSAIDAVALLGKPIAEVMTRRANLADLRADLRDCLKLVGESRKGVKFWIRRSKYAVARYRYGFYREPWVLVVLDFLDGKKSRKEEAMAGLGGLLYGYSPCEIQKFIDEKVNKRKKRP